MEKVGKLNTLGFDVPELPSLSMQCFLKILNVTQNLKQNWCLPVECLNDMRSHWKKSVFVTLLGSKNSHGYTCISLESIQYLDHVFHSTMWMTFYYWFNPNQRFHLQEQQYKLYINELCIIPRADTHTSYYSTCINVVRQLTWVFKRYDISSNSPSGGM